MIFILARFQRKRSRARPLFVILLIAIISLIVNLNLIVKLKKVIIFII